MNRRAISRADISADASWASAISGFAPLRCGMAFVLLTAGLLEPTALHAQAAPSAAAKAEPDTILYANGEKLVGEQFEGLIGGAAKFKSDKVGEIAIDLSAVPKLQASSHRFAVVRTGREARPEAKMDGKNSSRNDLHR